MIPGDVVTDPKITTLDLRAFKRLSSPQWAWYNMYFEGLAEKDWANYLLADETENVQQMWLTALSDPDIHM